jgi:hypothetical protein
MLFHGLEIFTICSIGAIRTSLWNWCSFRAIFLLRARQRCGCSRVWTIVTCGANITRTLHFNALISTWWAFLGSSIVTHWTNITYLSCYSIIRSAYFRSFDTIESIITFWSTLSLTNKLSVCSSRASYTSLLLRAILITASITRDRIGSSLRALMTLWAHYSSSDVVNIWTSNINIGCAWFWA